MKLARPKIRSYSKEDEAAVLHLAQKYASWDASLTQADIQGFHASEPGFFLVAELEGRVVGFIFGRESNVPVEVLEKWRATRVGSVETLAVDQAYRRQGIATQLLDRLIEAFKENQIDTVTLSMPAHEVAAKKLYDKFGFETRGYFLRKRL